MMAWKISFVSIYKTKLVCWWTKL